MHGLCDEELGLVKAGKPFLIASCFLNMISRVISFTVHLAFG